MLTIRGVCYRAACGGNRECAPALIKRRSKLRRYAVSFLITLSRNICTGSRKNPITPCVYLVARIKNGNIIGRSSLG